MSSRHGVRAPEYAVCALLLACGAGCLHDLDIPLRNYLPRTIQGDLSALVLYYPDTLACTLTVDDLSDSVLAVDAATWPGTFRQLDDGLGPKRIALEWQDAWVGARLGDTVSGVIDITDQQGARDRVPYSIAMLFADQFDVCPLPDYWQAPTGADSLGTLRLSDTGARHVEFFFPANPALGGPASLTMASRFGLAGDFSFTLWYSIPRDMGADYEVSFAVSSTPDTARYAGGREVALALLDQGTGFQVKYRDQFSSFGPVPAAGEYHEGAARFGRVRDTVTLEHVRADTSRYESIPWSTAPLFYSYSDTVYLHVRMTVSDFSEERRCMLRGLTIDTGVITH